MITYLLGIIFTFMIVMMIRGKKAITQVFSTGIYCIIGAFVVCSVVNVVRINDLPTKYMLNSRLTLLNFEINHDTTYYVKDTVRIIDSGIENLKITTTKFKHLNDIDLKSRKKVLTYATKDVLPLMVDSNNLIQLRFKDGEDEDDISSLLMDNSSAEMVIKRISGTKYTLSLYDESYVGDKWTANLSLPNKSELYVLGIPQSDTLINSKVLKNYKLLNDESKLAQLNN